ncbi:peptidoglycan DD-metalloendopeptidase family protein [Chitinivorax sp. B]|uniref:murein hydrolase activator EnvC family protein n=1 Tax=Chitinivorax sp. B TaxID=2502235 RepID=UPI0010F43A41|nr:peptidoglycan DD-metalloendopeptidase family protein [Chitinivorax sp. B]
MTRLPIPLLTLALLITAPTVLTAPKETAPPKAELKELKQQIETLQQQIQQGEAVKAEATDALKESESAISSARRTLEQLSREHQQLRQELQTLKDNLAQRHDETTKRQLQLGKLLNAHYRAGQIDAVKLILSNQDLASAQRELGYYRYIAQAEAKLIGELQQQISILKQLVEETADKARQLQKVEQEKREYKRELEGQKQARSATLNKISADLKTRRAQVDKLKADEQRLTQLIERLARLAEQRAKAERERTAKLAAEQAKARQRALAAANRNKRETKSNGQSSNGSTKPIERNEQIPEPTTGSSNFVTLKGRLRLPVRGDILHRFGDARADGGTTWKGMFIRTGNNDPVHAVAAGQVVFADWLRGFGNLLIIDHGGGYLSLYGHNESVLKQPGDRVSAGDVVGRTGNTGGSDETGLYFELRHLGKPLNPAQWAS